MSFERIFWDGCLFDILHLSQDIVSHIIIHWTNCLWFFKITSSAASAVLMGAYLVARLVERIHQNRMQETLVWFLGLEDVSLFTCVITSVGLISLSGMAVTKDVKRWNLIPSTIQLIHLIVFYPPKSFPENIKCLFPYMIGESLDSNPVILVKS